LIRGRRTRCCSTAVCSASSSPSPQPRIQSRDRQRSTDTANPQPPFNKDGCNTGPAFATGADGVQVLSMYRRPRIAANLPFAMTTRSDLGVDPPPAIDPINGQQVAVGTPPETIDPRTGRPISGNIMWDGREPTLEQQASDARQGHAQGLNPPTSTQISEMVQFELGIFSAQIWDAWALDLPRVLSGGQNFYPAECSVCPRRLSLKQTPLRPFRCLMPGTLWRPRYSAQHSVSPLHAARRSLRSCVHHQRGRWPQ
jgi:hypothetical protein